MADDVMSAPQARQRRNRDDQQSTRLDHSRSLAKRRSRYPSVQARPAPARHSNGQRSWPFRSFRSRIRYAVRCGALDINPDYLPARTDEPLEPLQTCGRPTADRRNRNRIIGVQFALQNRFQNPLAAPKPPVPFLQICVLFCELLFHRSVTRSRTRGGSTLR